MVRLGKKKVTQSTLAEALQLSRNTVARVLNNQPGVAESTRKAVLEKAYELGYALPGTLNMLEGPALPHKEIAFLGHTNFMTLPFWVDIIQGMESYLTDQGITLRLALVSSEQIGAGILPASLSLSELNGIVMAGTFPLAYYELVQRLNLPTITYDMAPDMMHRQHAIDIISLNNEAGVFTVTKRLIEKGFRRIAYAGSPLCSASFAERRQGFDRAMQQYRLEPIRIRSLEESVSNASNISKKELIRELGAMSERPTAYVCANDAITNKLLTLKRDFPAFMGEAVLTSFDNTLSPKDTAALFATVDPHRVQIGHMMAVQLCNRLKNPTLPHMVIRLNTTPLFADDRDI